MRTGLTGALFLVSLWLFFPPSGPGARADEARTGQPSTTAYIDDFPMPPTEGTANQEIVKNNDQIAQIEKTMNDRQMKLGEENARYDDLLKRLHDGVQALMAMKGKCPARPRPRDLGEALGRIKTALDGLRGLVKVDADSDPARIYSALDGDAKALCDKDTDPAWLGDDKLGALFTGLKGWRDEYVRRFNQEIVNLGKEKDARQRLRTRLEEQAQKLRQTSDKTATLTTDLKWLILILGGLSVLVMLIIRLYPVELQTEWVASGQVIQFMTVLVLLIAILILGLANILKENTLGTLLGGIGGYVLAQGVGRAAARTAARQAVRSETAALSQKAGPPAEAPPGVAGKPG